jgi:uncharacterized cofD-like protein
MWQPGETIGFKASDHVRAIHKHARARLLDVVVLNSAPIPDAARRSYAARKAEPVKNDVDSLKAMGLHVLEQKLTAQGPKIRHDPAALADVLVRLAVQGRRSASLRPEGSVVPFPIASAL